ncbi:MAG: alpha/beta fold hydrolase [Pseudomonadales bacterium]
MSKRTKVQFPATSSQQGLQLNGLLELPQNSPIAFVLFAHCFTCGKDIAAASRISRSLVARGFGVLRFDFTGLGNSDGDFSNTNFSSNIADLVSAADFLRREYQAPSILVGHSLGGAAVLKAAQFIPESLGVVTIAAPSSAEHVIKNFAVHVEDIDKHGQADVNLAGRAFVIKKQFLDDLRDQSSDHIASLKKALLIFHSPVDATVSISEAEKIYRQAKHPKSFITLDNADHLLTSKDDAEYVATSIATWATRYLPSQQLSTSNKASTVQRGHVIVGERNKQFTRDIHTDNHYWLSDEPLDFGGDNLGPDPYEQLLASIGACTSMTIRMYANRKKLALDDVSVTLSHSRTHIKDCQDCDSEKPQSIEVISREITLKGDLTDAQKQRLMEIADKCPVHKTLHGNLSITSTLVD